jgi:MYXO-CTERM domain-containing protein
MRYAIAAIALLSSLPARAHLGAVLAHARFDAPATPMVTPIDLGVAFDPSYVWATADQSFTISWQDGDNDPTGNFYFYYMDHDPTFQILPTDIPGLAHPVLAAAGDPAVGESPVTMWAGCSCNGDMGVICPDAGDRSAMMTCRNSFAWDTSSVPAGSWWLVAVNNDDPYHIYNVAGGPVRVQHGGGTLPPAVIVLRPDGYNSFDKSYRVQWAAVGTPPLKFDLAYGPDELADGGVYQPPIPLVSNVQAIMNSDGTFSWDWDVSQLGNLGIYYLRVTVTDGNGVTAFTDSRFGLSVYHPNADGGSSGDDSGVVPLPPPKKSGCSCNLGGDAAGPLVIVPLALLSLVLIARRRA